MDIRKLLENFNDFSNQTPPNLLQRIGSRPPETNIIMISCPDARTHPCILFNLTLGEVFNIRTIAAWVPEYKSTPPDDNIKSALSLALLKLPIQDIVILGHTNCVGMQCAYQHNMPKHDPMEAWSSGVAKQLKDKSSLNPRSFLLNSYTNLLTNPMVAKQVNEGKIKCHAWCINFEQEKIEVYT